MREFSHLHFFDAKLEVFKRHHLDFGLIIEQRDFCSQVDRAGIRDSHNCFEVLDAGSNEIVELCLSLLMFSFQNHFDISLGLGGRTFCFELCLGLNCGLSLVSLGLSSSVFNKVGLNPKVYGLLADCAFIW